MCNVSLRSVQFHKPHPQTPKKITSHTPKSRSRSSWNDTKKQTMLLRTAPHRGADCAHAALFAFCVIPLAVGERGVLELMLDWTRTLRSIGLPGRAMERRAREEQDTSRKHPKQLSSLQSNPLSYGRIGQVASNANHSRHSYKDSQARVRHTL